MTRLKIVIIILITAALFFSSLFLYLINREEHEEEEVELVEKIYRNEKLGYTISYPEEWEVREVENLSFFHPALVNEDFSQKRMDFKTYKQIFGVDFIGTSPLVYIDGNITYNIEKRVYPNINEFTVRQWYDVAAIADARHAQKISSAHFIRKSNRVIESKEGISDDGEKIFDPWMTRGKKMMAGEKEVLKTVRDGDYRYDGYQYYTTSLGDYIFVFRFGYGGPVTPREMWERNNMYIKEMIDSLELL